MPVDSQVTEKKHQDVHVDNFDPSFLQYDDMLCTILTPISTEVEKSTKALAR